MKKIFLFLSLFSLCHAEIKVVSPSAVTYEWLTLSPDSDSAEYVPYFKEVFDQLKVKAFLQVGIGYSTKYLLENCKRVVTVDFVTPGCGPDRFKEFLNFYKNFSNWIAIAYFTGYKGDTNWAFFKYLGSDKVFLASNYQSTQFRSYAATDNTYLTEMGSFFGNLVKLNHFEVAFIDPSIFVRGDLVQILFGKVPVIFAFDASCRLGGARDVYGYGAVTPPSDYEEIYLRGKNSAVVWILKNEKYNGLIEALKRRV